MSKKNQYSNDDMFMDQPQLGYYSFPPMFRCEYNEPVTESINEPENELVTEPANETIEDDLCETFSDANRAEPMTPLPINPQDSYIEPSLTNIAYTQAFLRTLIGKRVRITFLLGTGNFTDRAGILEKVGVSYIVIRQPESNTHIMCDLYSIKFVDYFE